jgi:class 3 adenylate cyclase/tetratricopeptide (TPR) repeat protein
MKPLPVDGERRFLTILFADVVGSTSLAERLDPEVWAELMQGAFTFMYEAVGRYGGTVNRVIGDEILAFFGDPVAHEDDAERAVRAGLDIQRSASAYGADILREHGLDFMVRVGINTGLAVVGSVGDAKGGYTAMGDVANVAARLQAGAEPGTVLVGKDTWALVGHLFEGEARTDLAMKGKGAGVEAYLVTAERSAPGVGRGLHGIASPLVGRDTEFALVRGRLEEVRQGRGGFVSIVAEAGLGKSRLVAELRAQAPGDAVDWWEGRGVSYAQRVHYLPWRHVILASLGATAEDEPATLRARLERALAGQDEGARADLPFLETVLAIESEASRSLIDDAGDDVVALIAAAVQRYVRSLAATRPTVIVFDDLHWADAASVELVAAMVDVTRECPLLFVCMARPERSAASWALLEGLRRDESERLLEIRLEPLRGAHAATLLDNLLPGRSLPERVRSLILEKSDGNPFFLEEVLRMLADMDQLVREDGRWRADAGIEAAAIPDTLAGVLGARIDRLPGATKRVAQTASVIGRTFARRVLHDVVRESGAPAADDVDAHLGVLTSEELVRERPKTTEPEFIFKHALTKDAAYARLLLRRRRELHRLVGTVLERLHADRLDDVAPILAEHFASGESWERAARYVLRSAARSAGLHAVGVALDAYAQAIEWSDRASVDDPVMRFDARLGWVKAAVSARLHERPERRPAIVGRVDEAIALARTLDDPRRLTEALVTKGNVLSLSGQPAEGFGPLLEAHDLARALGDDKLFLMPYWAATEMLLGDDPRAAAAHFEHVIDLARRARNKGIEAHALGSRALALARLGEFAAAREAIDVALVVGPQSKSVIKEADVNILAGATFIEMGDVERGLEHSRVGTAMAASVRGLECVCSGWTVSGTGELERQRFDAATHDFGEAIRVGMDAGIDERFEPYLIQVRGAHAATRLVTGDASALHELEDALASATRAGDPYGVATLSHALGARLVQLGRLGQAEPHLATALASFRARGMRPYEARVLATEAELREALGDHEGAAARREESERIVETLRLADQPARPHPLGAAAAPRPGLVR